jgi:hypothetical protein
MLVAAPAFVLLGALSLSSIMDIYAGDLRTAADESADASKAADSAAASSTAVVARQKSKSK